MRRVFLYLSMFALAAVSMQQAKAADRTDYDELVTILDSARVLEVPVFAPKTWAKVERAFNNAQQAIDRQKNQKTLNKHVANAREYAENALRATEVGKLSLQEYLEPREKAIIAKGPKLVPKLYGKAEIQFKKATEKVEKGDVKGALKEAEKSSPLFDVAEMEAIRADLLGGAARLIEKAVSDDAGRFALSTLDKARTALTKANAILTDDRYNRTNSIEQAKRAEYEARHASNIALSVRALNRNDQAWEKLMLLYEIQMNRIGEAIGLEHLPFDNGPLAAADTLLVYIKNLQQSNARLSGEMGDLSTSVVAELKTVLSQFDETITIADPIMLIEMLQRRLDGLSGERDDLTSKLQASESKLSRLSMEHEAVAADLSVRVERDEKFKQAKKVLNPSEGEILFNSSNDIVLRLGGLSFDIGKSDIKDEHIPLLAKVQQVIEMFPGTQLVVEGHTDASGEQAANVTLSEKRAFAVMQYLRQSMLIPANQIQSIGYGADRPIASNQTKDGRAKNRRIDILIMR